jgi:hypothetical protein
MMAAFRELGDTTVKGREQGAIEVVIDLVPPGSVAEDPR